MKKLFAVGIAGLVAALLLLSVGSKAGWNGCTSGFCNKPVATSGFTPSCSQSSTFLAAATGVTLIADKQNYDTLICGLVSDGVWNFDALYIWAAPTQATALINLANPGTFNATANGTVSFTAYQGFTGDGSTFYIDSGFNPSTAVTPNFVQNSATVGAYILTSRATGTNMWDIGCSVGGCTSGTLFAPYNAGNFSSEINSASILGGANSNAQGAYNLTRNNASSEAIFLNSGESSVSQTADTSVTPPNINVLFFAFNTGFGFSTDQMAAGWIGVGVGNSTPGSGVNSCKINNRINTYMASLSVPKNVYSNSAC